MIKGEYEAMKDLASRNLCAEHNTPLSVAWHDKESIHVLRCGHGHYPDTIVKNPSFTELWKQGQLDDGPVKDAIVRRERKRVEKQAGQGDTTGLALVPSTDLATGQRLTPEQIYGLVQYAVELGLDPFRSHVAMMYGKPYITIDGYLFHANESDIDYQLRSRPLEDDERKTYQIPEGAHAWTSEVIIDEGRRSFTGLGIVTREEMTEWSKKNPEQLASPVVARHPWQLAQKRAEWQALRRAFPLGKTQEVEVE